MLKNPVGYKHSKVLKWEEHPCLSEFIMRGIRWNQSVILQCSFFNKEITNLSSKCSERKKQQLVLTLIITSWKSWGAVTYIFSKVIFSKSDLNSSVCDWSAGENGRFFIFIFFPRRILFLFSCQIKITQRNIFPVWEADWDILTWKKKQFCLLDLQKQKQKYSAGRIFPGRNFW